MPRLFCKLDFVHLTNAIYFTAVLYPTPVKQITWLKRLWWLGCPVSMEELKESLPDTEIVFPQWSYTADGWRGGENYYAQRDFMGEAYMVASISFPPMFKSSSAGQLRSGVRSTARVLKSSR